MTIQTEELAFVGQGGARILGVLATPAGERGRGQAGIVLVHEVFGCDHHMRELAARFAREGFCVLLPDLYAREGLPGPTSTDRDPAPEWTRDQIRAAVGELSDRRALADLDAATKAVGELEWVDPLL